jgi:uncharacterized protein YndB with AHSA1/START domain
MSDVRNADDIAPSDVVTVVRRIAAPPEIVFGYLVDPARFVQWMGVRADLDPRPGGGFHVTVGPDAVASGEYEVVEPPHRLVFSWGWQGDPDVAPGSTRVEVVLTAEGAGTLLELRHTGLPSEASRSRHEEGWAMYLAQLETLLGG